jgi:Domain of unknown function (DUF4167)
MRQGSNPRRSRGRGPRKPHNPHNPSRPQNFDGSGQDVRVRGNTYQVMEKYLALARDASLAGDRVAMENYLQHAEHYYRTINADGNRPRPPMRNDGQPGNDGNQNNGQYANPQHAGQPGGGQGSGGGNGQGDMQGNGQASNGYDGNGPDSDQPQAQRATPVDPSDDEGN